MRAYVQPEDGVDAIHGAVLDHADGAALVLLVRGLLGRLEEEPDSPAWQLAALVEFRQEARRADQHGDVRVVTAGVHDPWDGRAGADVVRLVDREGVHVGAERYDRAVRGSDLGDDAGAADASADAVAEGFHGASGDIGRAVFLERELRVAVEIAAEFDQLGFEPLGKGQEHGRCGCWARPGGRGATVYFSRAARTGRRPRPGTWRAVAQGDN